MPVIYGHASNLRTILYQIQDVQIAAISFNWDHEAVEGCLLYGSYSCHSDLDAGVWSIRHAPPARTLSAGHLHQYCSFPPHNTAESCYWPDWPPSSALQHPSWLLSRHRSGDCCLYRHQRLTHIGLHKISQLQPI